MKRLASLQILRALAAMAVTLFHACQWSRLDFAVGAAGVDVFFVVSGFVLWVSAQVRPVTPGAFLKAPLAFAMAVAAGLACYRWIERPLRSVVGRQGQARRRVRLGFGPAEQEALAAVDADLA